MSFALDQRLGRSVFARRATPYRMCGRCLMDTSDPEIDFDGEGVCNHCRAYHEAMRTHVLRGEHGRRALAAHVERLRAGGRGGRYDCVIGLSGGVDSSYTALVVKRLGLRPLAVHLDNGWNSEIAVRNIENVVKKLELDLHTEVLDWDEFRRLQLAFLRASTPDCEVPTDHAIVATLYRVARRHGIRWICDGGNIATEMMVPSLWSHGHSDWKYIRSVHQLFDGRPLQHFPHYTVFESKIGIPHLERIGRISVLNYVDYDKPAAVETLRRELEWQQYGAKHYESIYTRFYQGYILKEKFGFDKRRSHLSCLVNDGKLSKAQALAELDKPAIAPTQLREDRAFVIKKLGVDEAEFDRIMAAERKTFWDYPSYEKDLLLGSAWSEAVWTARAFRALRAGYRLVRPKLRSARSTRAASR